MTPMFTPEPSSYPAPKVFVSAVGEKMTELCGETADGVLLHAFTTKRYLDEVTVPALMRGVERAGRRRGDVAVSAPVFVVTGNTEDEIRAASVATRKQIAFYGSTPAYRGVLEMHGWGDLATELHGLSRRGEWDTMGSLIDDGVLDAFAVVAPLPELAGALRRRCHGTVDRVMAGLPAGTPEPVVTRILDELRGG
jgi:probable F420-dependent oxidoreductase